MVWIIFFQGTDSGDSSLERNRCQQERLRDLAEFLPVPTNRLYYLLATDTTPAPRRYAKTLKDRHIVHYPNPAPGNKPIVVGHHYSTVALLPEKEAKNSPPWAIPIRLNRVASSETGNSVATKQIHDLLTDKELPFAGLLTVNTVDSCYGVAIFLSGNNKLDNLITVARSRANRVFYHQHIQSNHCGPGRPKNFGKRFKLKEPTTWDEPDKTTVHPHQLRSGEEIFLELNGWTDMLMRGKRNAPMHNQPFTLIQARLFRKNGSQVFQRPLWLIIHGNRRDELSLHDAWQAYRQRYDIEHFFRFGKRRLLLDSYQTPELEHEENWWEIVMLSYLQLWMASPLATWLPNPWEKHLSPPEESSQLGPSQVQRDFERIIHQIEGKLPSPKPRGKSPGRAQGDCPEPRDRQAINFKSKKKAA